MNINEFKVGDEIVRVEKSKGIGDRSYIGDKLILKAIANGCIYCVLPPNNIFVEIIGKDTIKLEFDIFSDGWDYYQEIDSFPENNLKHDFKIEIQKAIDEENYELLASFKKILDNI